MMDPIQPIALAPLQQPELAMPMSMPAPAVPAGTDFMALVGAGLTGLEHQTEAASRALASYAVGGDVSPHELMIAMEGAKLSMQFAVEVRNRLVEAYQELSRMQV